MSESLRAPHGGLLPYPTAVEALAPAAAAARPLRREEDLPFEGFVRRHAGAAWELLPGLFESDEAIVRLEQGLSGAWSHGLCGKSEVTRYVVGEALAYLTRHPHEPLDVAAWLPRFSERGHLAESPTPWPRGTLAAPQLQRRLRGWLRRLPEPYRGALWLHDVCGCSKARSAELLQLPADALDPALHRGRLVLRALLAHELQGQEPAPEAAPKR